MRCCPMGDPIRKPAKSTSAKRTGTSPAPMHRRGSDRRDDVYQLVDFVVTRLLVLTTTVAIARGQATPEMAAVIGALCCVLRIRPGR